MHVDLTAGGWQNATDQNSGKYVVTNFAAWHPAIVFPLILFGLFEPLATQMSTDFTTVTVLLKKVFN